MSAPFRRRRDGSIAVELSEPEVAVVRGITAEVAGAVGEAGPGTERLFPPGYTDDAEREEHYVSLTRDDLVASKLQACKRVLASIDAGDVRRRAWHAVLAEEDAQAWLWVINDARLVLGTRLDVTEDMDHAPLPEGDARAPAFNTYLYLSALQEALIEELLPGVVVPEEDQPR